MKNEKRYYAYTLAYPENYPDEQLAGKVFYVGKGSRSRAQNHLVEARKGAQSQKCDIIRKIWKSGKQVAIHKIAFFDSEAEAYECEKKLIRDLGLSNLTNMADGGKGGARPGAGAPKRFIHKKIPLYEEVTSPEQLTPKADFCLAKRASNEQHGIAVDGIWYTADEALAIAAFVERSRHWLDE